MIGVSLGVGRGALAAAAYVGGEARATFTYDEEALVSACLVLSITGVGGVSLTPS